MELKYYIQNTEFHLILLLIVLNGIEIIFYVLIVITLFLLIVLNGIEMYEALQRWKEVAQLLIVLNGIEICRMIVYIFRLLLLIVLNGIEMLLTPQGSLSTGTFNRTKWN